MKIKPLNMKKYMVPGTKLEEIGLVVDALTTISRICDEDYPDDAVFSLVRLAYIQLDDILTWIEENQEIVGGHQITVSSSGTVTRSGD